MPGPAQFGLQLWRHTRRVCRPETCEGLGARQGCRLLLCYAMRASAGKASAATAYQACCLAAGGHLARVPGTTAGVGGLAAAEHAACWLGTATLCGEACMPGSCRSAACSGPAAGHCRRMGQALQARQQQGSSVFAVRLVHPASQAWRLSGSGRLGLRCQASSAPASSSSSSLLMARRHSCCCLLPAGRGRAEERAVRGPA